MACMHHIYIHNALKSIRIYATSESSDDQNDRTGQANIRQFALESGFRRRFLTGIGTASVVALGANFAGITTSLLGLAPDSARSLRLDVIYPIGGYSRCIDTNEGFEFLYPSNWVRDQTVFFRAARRAERSLDPPPLSNGNDRRPRKNVNEPVVAFGPPGSNGELNVSVIVASVPIDFSIETFGGAQEVGEAIVRTITGKRADVKGTLIQTNLREDKNVKYYTLEFKVESPAFQRHNVAVCCAKGGKLFTLNSQAPESLWPKVKTDFHRIADSFSLTS